MIPNVIISVNALAKAGKNHFAYTAPDPIRVYCFNGGADFVATKFPSKAIDVQNFHLPIVESENMKWAEPVWEEFRRQYDKDIDEGKYNTYVFDTGTEVENVCQQAVLEDQQEVAAGKETPKDKQKLATTEYLARNLKMKALFDMAKMAGVNLVTLQYLKEEWIKTSGQKMAEPTGKLILDGWKRTPSQADINIEMVMNMERIEGEGGKPVKIPVVVSTIVSNRFDPAQNEATFENLNFDDLMIALFEDGE